MCRLTSSRAPNAPPTPPRRQAHQLLGESEALRHLLAVVVQPLGRDDAGRRRRRRSGIGEPGLGTQERLVLHADLVRALDDDRARCVGVAAADDQLRGRRCRRGGSAARRRCGLGVGERLEHARSRTTIAAHGAARGLGVVGGDAATGSPT